MGESMPYPSIPARAESQPWGCLPLPCLPRVPVPGDPCQLSDPPPQASGSLRAVRSSRLPSLLWTPAYATRSWSSVLFY